MPSARETRDAILKDKITEVWKGRKGREVYGARKVWLELNQQGVTVARCTVERLMRDLGLAGVRAGRKRPRTTVPEDAAVLIAVSSIPRSGTRSGLRRLARSARSAARATPMIMPLRSR
jgi:transposase InsO family protein